jgi:poly [ADP-ribose] polymerase
MSKVARLILVSAQNNNKFYNMTEKDEELVVEYGRVDSSKTTRRYPLRMWDKKYNEKLRKGYKDVTAFRLKKESTDFTAISDDKIAAIVNELQAYANKSIQNNYSVSSESVTQAQVDEAQKVLNVLADLSQDDMFSFTADSDEVNKYLLDLYQIIPRKMRRVQDYLIDAHIDMSSMKNILLSEQATLDVMKGQVHVSQARQQNDGENASTILNALGLDIQTITSTEEKLIKKELGEIDHKFRKGFKITNKQTDKRFFDFVEKRKNKTIKLFWHGSRNENWWNILDTGLILRPTNVITTGSMYGKGLYMADKARKSYGYTSCRGSYWARGSSDKGFMSLYEVHIGNPLKEKHHRSWMYNLTEEKLKEKGDYDSFFAVGGADLINNEYIIYNEAQCTIRYLVEVD